MIWLLRHGDAGDAATDFERPLTKKGHQQSDLAGRALAALGAKPGVCLSSPKVRALQTARAACEHLGIEPTEEEALSGGSFDPNELTDGRADVLLVGHEPSMSEAIEVATKARPKLKKGGLAAIDDGELLLLLRPAELRALARK